MPSRNTCLAAEGVRFHRAYVAQAGCIQSRASVLTGLYPHQHGQIVLATWGFRMYREDAPNLPRSLKAAGYRTGMIGIPTLNEPGRDLVLRHALRYDEQLLELARIVRREIANPYPLAHELMVQETLLAATDNSRVNSAD